MKKIFFFSALAAVSLSVNAHMIEGIQILKGAIKTKITINSVKTTCRVKVDKIKNLMLEDSWGNPAYNVRAVLGLDGDDYQRSLSIKTEKEAWFNNLFPNGAGTEVRDLEYRSSDGSTLTIDKQGRIKKVSLLYEGKMISCQF